MTPERDAPARVHGAVPVTKAGEGPVPTRWRPVLGAVVDALVRRDYGLRAGIDGVAPVSADSAEHIRRYIEDYGATLVPLPQEAWDTSVCSWTGHHWDVMVDLWTEEEGSSDLVLQMRVVEQDEGYLAEVHMVYVP